MDGSMIRDPDDVAEELGLELSGVRIFPDGTYIIRCKKGGKSVRFFVSDKEVRKIGQAEKRRIGKSRVPRKVLMRRIRDRKRQSK